MRTTLLCVATAMLASACSSSPPPDDSMMQVSAGAGTGGAAGMGGTNGIAGGDAGGMGGSVTGSTEAGGTAGASGEPMAGTDAGGMSSGGAGLGGAGLGGAAGGPAYVPSEEVAMLLSETGLYSDIATETLAPGVLAYEPQFALWSDGATKRRWIWLPPGTQIDTGDMDNWAFPIGTKIWKEFTRDGVRIETRLIERFGTGGRRWKMLAYIWNDGDTDAAASPMGQENAKGTEHDVPNEEACKDCHDNRTEKPIGVSAIQLSHQLGGLNLESLVADDRLTVPPTASPVVPGTEVERAALGYLHANCGNCHRDASTANSRVDVRMWLEVDTLGSVETTDAYTQLVNQRAIGEDSDCTVNLRVFGGDPERSEVFRRMSQAHRAETPMPPVGSELEDPEGLEILSDWINSLPAPGDDALPDPCCFGAAESCCTDNPTSPSCP